MGVAKIQVTSALSPPLPIDIVNHLLDDYIEIKTKLCFSEISS